MRMLGATMLAIVSLAATAPDSTAAPGDLDPAFGGGAGWVRPLEVRAGEGNYLPRGAEDIALQPDGKVVAAGELQDGRSSWYFGVFRYNADGGLDTSFGSGGWTAVDLGSFEHPRAVAVQPDGRIVVGGETDCATARCFAAMRFNPDGSIDTSFGAGGVVRHEFYLNAAWANDMAIDRRGRIVLAGSRLRGGDAQDSEVVCVMRLLPDGRPDPGFSGDGVALVDHGYGNDSAEAVALQGGRIVVAGEGRDSAAGARFGIARLRSDGRLDRSFGRRGHRLLSFGRRRLAMAHAVAAAPGGGIVVAGSAVIDGQAPHVAVARLGGNVRNGSLTGSDIENGSLAGRDLDNGTVTGSDLKNSSVTTSDIRGGSLLGSDFKPGELPAGAPGPQGPAGPTGAAGSEGPAGAQGPGGATDVVARRENVNLGAPPIGGYTLKLGVASCEDGEIAVGGGAGITNLASGFSLTFGGEPLEADGSTPEIGEVATQWRAAGINNNTSAAQTLTVHVLCAKP